MATMITDRQWDAVIRKEVRRMVAEVDRLDRKLARVQARIDSLLAEADALRSERQTCAKRLGLKIEGASEKVYDWFSHQFGWRYTR